MDGISVLYYSEGEFKSNPQLYTKEMVKKDEYYTFTTLFKITIVTRRYYSW